MKDTIEIDGVEYRALSTEEERMCIVIVDNRGLTFVGRIDIVSGGDWPRITGARCVVQWGTDEHLAQLCSGPRENTVLGFRHDVIVRRDNIVAVYECDIDGGWFDE